jgi:hypothetical protein
MTNDQGEGVKNNDVRIDYALRIETMQTLAVESIVDGIEIDTAEPRYHEELADLMLSRFGGMQTLIADHHGVTIETKRKGPGKETSNG